MAQAEPGDRRRPSRPGAPVATPQAAAGLRRLTGEAIRLARRAAPHELSMLLAIDLLGAGLVIVEVLVGRSFLAALLLADRTGAAATRALPAGVLLAGATAALGAAGAGAAYYQRVLAELASQHAQDMVLDVTQAVELIDFEDAQFYDRVTRARAGAQRLAPVITSLSGLLRTATTAGGALVGLLVLAPLLAPLVCLALAPAAYAASRRGRLFYRYAFEQTPTDRERVYLERLLVERESAQELRAFGLASFLRRRHRRLCEQRMGALRMVARRIMRLTLLADLAGSALVALAATVLLLVTLGHRHALATAAAGGATVLFLGRRIGTAGASAAGLSESAVFLEDLLALGRPAAAAVAGGPEAAARHPGRVAAEGVTFRYPGSSRAALENITLHIDVGELVALVGANGSGKTSLAKVLAGLYRPSAGRVLWDGEDIAACPAPGLSASTAVIFQDFLRYAFTARENIGLGRHERENDLPGIRAAAARAGAHGSIAALGRGYETLLGPIFEGGTDLSVGQWQRVALARMVFRDAPFVILDEPTAALDALAEQELFSAMRELLAGRTALMISHRLSSVRSADRIYVLHEGRLAEHGTHAGLISAGGIYADLFSRQAAAYR